jgi:hypothetical protein
MMKLIWLVFPFHTIASLLAAEDAFLESYCYRCHDAEVKKGGLDLEGLARDPVDGSVAYGQWVKVYERLESGEMPPEDKEQPGKAAQANFLSGLHRELVGITLAARKGEGRAQLRRLNRVEYENTLRDLLGVGVDVQGILPEDNIVAGFDNQGAGLETSATHLVRYQEAAGVALDALYPTRILGGDASIERIRLTGKEYLESRQPVHRKGIDPYTRLDGDSFVYGAQLYKHGSMQTPRTKVAGEYTIRASMRALNSKVPIPVDIGKISTDRFGHEKLEHLLDVRDALPDESRVVEVRAFLPAGESVYLSPRTLTLFRNLEKDASGNPVLPDFSGPSLSVDWIELEGPYDEGSGYREFFGDWPRVPQRLLEDKFILANFLGSDAPLRTAKESKKFLMEGLESNKMYGYHRMNPNEFHKPHNHLRLLVKDPAPEAEKLIRRFLAKAFRRTPEEAVARHYLDQAGERLGLGMPLDEVLLKSYKEILCSPRFLYLYEEPGSLDGYALASRLSYFLWSSMPDDRLLRLAGNGQLLGQEVLRVETERMLKDPKALRFVSRFTGQWLDLQKFHDMKPDQIYKEYDEALAWSMPEETRRFFVVVLENDLPVTDFIHSNWGMLNSRLGKHYGIPGIEGLDLRRVELPENSRRGGLLAQGSILKLTTNATYTSPVKRGVWVLDRLVGKVLPPPPPDIAAVEPDIRGAVTIREQLDKHKDVPVCASCHTKIDPHGFALENYDVVGGWRERYRVAKGGAGIDYQPLPNYPGQKAYHAKPVEAFGKMPDGQPFQDIDAYKQLLLLDPAQIARNIAEKLTTYATGAQVGFADRQAIESIVIKSKPQGYGLRTILHEVVQSELFRNK